MKKTLLALAVMTAAGTVSATTIVENDKATVTTSGTAKVALVSGQVADGDERRAGINLGDAGIVFNVEHGVSDNLTAFGAFGITIEEGNIGSKDVNAGVKGDWGKVTMGQAGQAWNAGNSKHKELGLDPSDDDFISGDDVVKYDYSTDMFGFAISHNFTQTANEALFEGLTAVTGNVTLGPVVLGADYATKGDDSAYGFEATGTFGALSLGGAYLGVDADANAEVLGLIDYWVGYQVSDALAVHAGGQMAQEHRNDGSTIYVNADYTVAPSVSVFGELASISDDSDTIDSGLAFALGMSVAF